MNRRELLKGFAAGGIMIAGELWIPGQKFISISSGLDFNAYQFLDPLGRIVGDAKAWINSDAVKWVADKDIAVKYLQHRGKHIDISNDGNFVLRDKDTITVTGLQLNGAVWINEPLGVKHG